MAGNTVRIRSQFDDQVSGKLDKLRDRFDTMGKSKGFKSLVMGVGVGVGAAAFTALSRAAGSAVDVIGDAIAAANEDAASIQKLGTALKANVAGWDGNTEAIERVMAARMALGFSDDEQRDSLAKLVVATKDATKALDIQRTAMDLARLKGISLEEASEALVKVEAGQYRMLKSLGIVLRDGADQTEALAAVQRAAAGQAEDYAETTEGKLLVAQVKMNEALEKFGKVIAPVVADGITGIANAVDSLAGSESQMAAIGTSIAEQLEAGTVEGLKQSKAAIEAALNELSAGPGQNDFLAMTLFGDQVRGLRAQLAELDAELDRRQAFSRYSGKLDAMSEDVDTETTAMSRDWHAFAVANERASDAAIKALDDYREAAAKTARDVIDDAFDPIIAHDKLIADNAEISAARRILASGKASEAEKRDARETLHQTQQDTAEQLVTLAEAGQTNSKAFKTGIKNLKDAIKSAKGPTKAALQEVLDKIEAIERVGKVVNINFVIKGGRFSGKTVPLGFAEGGPVPGPKGAPQLAVVHGGEYVVPAGGAPIAGSGGGSGGPSIVYAPQFSTASPGEAQRFMRAIIPELTREMRRQGLVA